MGIDTLRSNFKDYAKDIKLNLSAVLSTDGAPDLTLNQIHGVALASAYSTKNQELITEILAEVSATLSDAEIEATKAAATVMAMNNVYYRFLHLSSNDEYKSLPAKLRMNIIRNSGVPSVDFELYSLAVSAINGCGMCVDSHEKQLKEAGVTTLGIQSAVRIASVINASAQATVIN